MEILVSFKNLSECNICCFFFVCLFVCFFNCLFAFYYKAETFINIPWSNYYYSVFECIFMDSVNHVKYFVSGISNTAQNVFRYILPILTQNTYLLTPVFWHTIYFRIFPYSARVWQLLFPVFICILQSVEGSSE